MSASGTVLLAQKVGAGFDLAEEPTPHGDPDSPKGGFGVFLRLGHESRFGSSWVWYVKCNVAIRPMTAAAAPPRKSVSSNIRLHELLNIAPININTGEPALTDCSDYKPALDHMQLRRELWPLARPNHRHIAELSHRVDSAAGYGKYNNAQIRPEMLARCVKHFRPSNACTSHLQHHNLMACHRIPSTTTHSSPAPISSVVA
jgi:hypothetical protein